MLPVAPVWNSGYASDIPSQYIEIPKILFISSYIHKSHKFKPSYHIFQINATVTPKFSIKLFLQTVITTKMQYKAQNTLTDSGSNQFHISTIEPLDLYKHTSIKLHQSATSHKYKTKPNKTKIRVLINITLCWDFHPPSSRYKQSRTIKRQITRETVEKLQKTEKMAETDEFVDNQTPNILDQEKRLVVFPPNKKLNPKYLEQGRRNESGREKQSNQIGNRVLTGSLRRWRSSAKKLGKSFGCFLESTPLLRSNGKK